MPVVKCKTCRRTGAKLFLKGDRCFSPKCAMVKKPYPPGEKAKKRTRSLSEYGKELKEKQKLRNWYNLQEKQFRKYIDKALDAQGKVANADVLLIKTLESRLDNIVFRLGFAPSRKEARQLVSHGHFFVNGRVLNIPSYLAKKGDKIALKPSSLNKKKFQEVSKSIKKNKAPS